MTKRKKIDIENFTVVIDRTTLYTNKLNMRKIFTSLVLLCATTLAFSAPVGRQQARQAALAFIKSHASTNSRVVRRASQAAPSLNEVASTNAYYIFNVGKGQGFVIASADDRTADVLG